MTVHQLLAARIAETSLRAVAAETGLSEQDLRGYLSGIALAAMPGERLRAWAAPQLPGGEPEVLAAPPRRVTAGPEPGSRSPGAPGRGGRTSTDAGWGFVRRAGRERPAPGAAHRQPTRPSRGADQAAAPGQRALPDVEEVREYVRLRVDEASPREVLAEIGPPMKRSNFYKFLNGSTPHQRIFTHLAAWYERAVAGERDTPGSRWRDVPVSVLRTYCAAEVERVGSQAAVAHAAGVSIRALQDFLTGATITQRRVLRGLGELYLARNGRLSDVKPVPPRPARVKEKAGPVEDDPDAPSVPIAALRAYVAAECRQFGSRRAFARAAGIAPNALRNFLEEATKPRRWNLRALALYYLAKGGELSEPPPPRAARARPRWTKGSTRPARRAYAFAFPADDIREYILRRVERSSMRVVASEIHARVGLASETVAGFVDGRSVPTERTAERLLSWYSEALLRAPISAAESVEHRRVPVDELHRFYSEAVARMSVRAVADRASVGPEALRKFVARSDGLQPRMRRNLGLYYLARNGVPEDPPPRAPAEESARPEVDALAPGAPADDGRPGLTPEQRRIDAIRAYARMRAGAKTARVIADEVGLNFSTFYNFLRGNRPVPRIREKIESWYARDSVSTEALAPLKEQLMGQPEGEPGASVVSTTVLRAFYAAAVTRGTASPHSLATQVRVSPAAFERFLAGDDVGRETLLRLRAFYAEHAMTKVAAVDAILEDLDGYVRTRARRRVLSAVARGYKEAGLTPAGWVEVLTAQRL